MITRFFTIKGKRYRLSTRSYDNHIDVKGPGIVGGIVILNETLDSPVLRAKLIIELEEYKKRRKSASEWVQEQVRKGLI